MIKIDSQFPSVRCYDNGGKTIDRFSCLFLNEPEYQPNTFACLAMNNSPFHPQGFGQHVSAMPGKHLGKRIDSKNLPADCQKLIRQDLGIWS